MIQLISPVRIRASLVLLMAQLVLSTSVQADDHRDEYAQIAHTVIFWLKEGTSSETANQLVDAVAGFESLPMVDHVYVGRPMPSEREVVDSSFGLAFTLIFSDENALRQYEADPEHRKISQEQVLPYVVRAVIYDYRQ